MTELDNINSDLGTVFKSLVIAFSRFLDYRDRNNGKDDHIPDLTKLRNLSLNIADKARTLDLRILAVIEKIREKEKSILPAILPCIHCNSSNVQSDYCESGGEVDFFTRCSKCDATNGEHNTALEAITAHNTLYHKLNPEKNNANTP